MVSLAEQRRGAEHLETEHDVSERRACQVIGICRSSKRRPSGRVEKASFAVFMSLASGIRGSDIGRSTQCFAARALLLAETDCV